jgi:hypothetical protein
VRSPFEAYTESFGLSNDIQRILRIRRQQSKAGAESHVHFTTLWDELGLRIPSPRVRKELRQVVRHDQYNVFSFMQNHSEAPIGYREERCAPTR